jgi:hypothetical protein
MALTEVGMILEPRHPLLAGRSMFGGGETLTDTIAAVLEEDPY